MSKTKIPIILAITVHLTIYKNLILSEFFAVNSIDRNINVNNFIEIRKEIVGFGFVYRSLTTTRKIKCQCPAKQSFKCDNKYCTTHSFACDYYKSNGKQLAKIIRNCIKHNFTAYMMSFKF